MKFRFVAPILLVTLALSGCAAHDSVNFSINSESQRDLHFDAELKLITVNFEDKNRQFIVDGIMISTAWKQSLERFFQNGAFNDNSEKKYNLEVSILKFTFSGIMSNGRATTRYRFINRQTKNVDYDTTITSEGHDSTFLGEARVPKIINDTSKNNIKEFLERLADSEFYHTNMVNSK